MLVQPTFYLRELARELPIIFKKHLEGHRTKRWTIWYHNDKNSPTHDKRFKKEPSSERNAYTHEKHTTDYGLLIVHNMSIYSRIPNRGRICVPRPLRYYLLQMANMTVTNGRQRCGFTIPMWSRPYLLK